MADLSELLNPRGERTLRDEQQEEPEYGCQRCGKRVDMALNGLMGVHCWTCYNLLFLLFPQVLPSLDKQGKPT